MIVDQLRLRNIGGLIIIDFIDMESAEHRKEVLAALTEALKTDKARANIVGFSELGLVEMTRQRTRESLAQRLASPARPATATRPRSRPSPPSPTRSCAASAARRRMNAPLQQVVVHLHPAVAAFLAQDEPAALRELERELGIEVIAQSRPATGRRSSTRHRRRRRARHRLSLAPSHRRRPTPSRVRRRGGATARPKRQPRVELAQGQSLYVEIGTRLRNVVLAGPRRAWADVVRERNRRSVCKSESRRRRRQPSRRRPSTSRSASTSSSASPATRATACSSPACSSPTRRPWPATTSAPCPTFPPRSAPRRERWPASAASSSTSPAATSSPRATRPTCWWR